MRKKNKAIGALASGFLILALAGSLLSFYGVAPAADKAGTAAAALTGIQVYFKLDPRFTRGLYMGDRWVSPPTYHSVLQAGKELTIEASAQGLDAGGRPVAIAPEWIPADPGMVAVSPSQGHAVMITVRASGQSSLKVATRGVTKELIIKATQRDNTIQVEISQ